MGTLAGSGFIMGGMIVDFTAKGGGTKCESLSVILCSLFAGVINITSSIDIKKRKRKRK